MKPQAIPPAQQLLVRIMNTRRDHAGAQSTQTSVTLVKGTQVNTSDGPRLVETLNAGDQIVTRSQGISVVSGLRRTRAMLHTVSVAVHSFGHNLPARDLVLPIDQQILIRDWRAKAMHGQPQAVVPVFELIDGVYVCETGLQIVDLVILTFDRPHVIYAEGMEIATSRIARQGLRPAA